VIDRVVISDFDRHVLAALRSNAASGRWPTAGDVGAQLGLERDVARSALLRLRGRDLAEGDVTPTGGKLGKWCSHRRDERKASRLSTERVAALDALGFVRDPLQQAFGSGYRCHRKRNRCPESRADQRTR